MIDAGELVQAPEQQDAIRRMRELRGAKASLRAISAEMARAGHKLSHEGVKKVLAAIVSPAPASPVAGMRLRLEEDHQ